jgi:GGDEF domain-containing protein
VSDLEGTAGGAIIVFHDDSSLRTLAQQLSWQASHDALTGLANRREFERALTELLASAASGHKTHALWSRSHADWIVDCDKFFVLFYNLPKL